MGAHSYVTQYNKKDPSVHRRLYAAKRAALAARLATGCKRGAAMLLADKTTWMAISVGLRGDNCGNFWGMPPHFRAQYLVCCQPCGGGYPWGGGGG